MSMPSESRSWTYFQRFVDDCQSLDSSMHRPCMPSPCPSCPFRRDRPVWLNAVTYVINLMRVNERKIQSCHKDCAKACYGSVILVDASSGGDADLRLDERIYTEREFRNEVPGKLASNARDVRDRYDEALAVGRMGKGELK